ncbi:MAG: 50S ribosomal protein L18 [Patescibacteria group bacterium]
MQQTHEQRKLRKQRVRARIRGTIKRPRFSVFRSNRHIFAQLIDDAGGRTLASASDLELKPGKKAEPLTRPAKARWIGEAIAKKAAVKNIHQVHFDRGRYKYHGLIKAVAEGARQGGLKF